MTDIFSSLTVWNAIVLAAWLFAAFLVHSLDKWSPRMEEAYREYGVAGKDLCRMISLFYIFPGLFAVPFLALTAIEGPVNVAGAHLAQLATVIVGFGSLCAYGVLRVRHLCEHLTRDQPYLSLDEASEKMGRFLHRLMLAVVCIFTPFFTSAMVVRGISARNSWLAVLIGGVGLVLTFLSIPLVDATQDGSAEAAFLYLMLCLMSAHGYYLGWRGVMLSQEKRKRSS